MKKEIEELLRSTERPGMEFLTDYMEHYGFYTAPCSSQYHLCKEGGLAEHSMNVFKTIIRLDESLTPCSFIPGYVINYNSLIIVSLLHDLGKMGQFGKPNYVPNMITDRKSKELIQSDKKPFETNKDLLTVPHEIRSIHIASQFIDLTEEESFAILYHNALYGDLKYQINGKERPLQTLLHFADLWVSRFEEV